MSEEWIKEAIAAQEEHIKRSRSCLAQEGRAHAFREYGDPGRPGVTFSRCVVCGVTQTSADYEKARGAGEK